MNLAGYEKYNWRSSTGNFQYLKKFDFEQVHLN